MKVVVVTQYYPPESVPLPADVARELVARGHQVTVITGYPNYPSGEIFPGYRQRGRLREHDGAVEVHRVPLFADHSHNAFRRLLNYGSFAVSSTFARRHSKNADVVYVYATQMTAGLGPWLWRLLGGAPYVLHIQDLWPESVTGSSMMAGSLKGRIVSHLLNPWLRSVYRRAGAVIGIAPTMVSMLVARGVSEDRSHLVYNWAEAGAAVSPSSAPHDRGQRAHVVYAGNVGEMQDLGTAVRAAHAARDAGVALTIVGDGVARADLRVLVNQLGADNVHFAESVPRERMPEVYARADFGLVSLRDMRVFRGTIPSKFQAVLAVGLPVIATVQGDVRSLVEDAAIGMTADSEDVASLEAAFREAAALGEQARRTMARRAADFHRAHFSRELGLSKIEALLCSVAEGTGRGR